MIAVDTNLLVYLYVPSARTAQAEAVFQQDPLWITAYLWRSEFRNTLVGLIRQGNLSLRLPSTWLSGRNPLWPDASIRWWRIRSCDLRLSPAVRRTTVSS